MKLTIKFPNGDIVEIFGYNKSVQKLEEIKEEDETVILECEVITTKIGKAAGTPEFLIAFLERQNENYAIDKHKHLPFGEMVKEGFPLVQPA
jgi:hypothetical protein